MSAKKHISTPLDDKTIKDLKIGDEVLISGTILTARDTAHKLLVEEFHKNGKTPISLENQIIFYVGPTPAKPGNATGSAGPTTSSRMDPYTPLLIEKCGLKGMIGKGSRTKEVLEAINKFKAVYFVTLGGAAALLSKCIKKSEVILYKELGPEAIMKLEVENFPAIVMNDIYGNDLSQTEIKKYSKDN